ncbi:tyrosine-type recombinase/integrase [Sphingomonas sp. DT-204]|uniref:tyrosine-type recombinase/integrase n=1 Tax=Sphingomonas sp. DT-204 TaxID=3396166 RepID=UPI003F19859F
MGRRAAGSVEKLPKYTSSYLDRHGKRRYRFRKGETDVTMKAHPGTRAHPSAEYKMLLAGHVPANLNQRVVAGTIEDLIIRYYSSADFNSAGATTQAKNRSILEAFRVEHGSKRADTIKFYHVEAMLVAKAAIGVDDRGRKIGGPFAAERFRKLLRRLFAHALKLQGAGVVGYACISGNPVELADAPATPKTTGFHTWTDGEIDQFRAHHRVGTKARLALEILRWTMQRGGDARTFSPTQRRNGQIEVWNEKNQKFTWVPEPVQLTEAIQAMSAIGAHTILVTDWGKPFSEKGFSQWFKKQCVAAGLPHCTAHGVRKSTARQLAEHVDATQQQLKAAGGWSGDREVSTYVAEANQKKLARTALTRLAHWDLANQQTSQKKGETDG